MRVTRPLAEVKTKSRSSSYTLNNKRGRQEKGRKIPMETKQTCHFARENTCQATAAAVRPCWSPESDSPGFPKIWQQRKQRKAQNKLFPNPNTYITFPCVSHTRWGLVGKVGGISLQRSNTGLKRSGRTATDLRDKPIILLLRNVFFKPKLQAHVPLFTRQSGCVAGCRGNVGSRCELCKFADTNLDGDFGEGGIGWRRNHSRSIGGLPSVLHFTLRQELILFAAFFFFF